MGPWRFSKGNAIIVGVIPTRSEESSMWRSDLLRTMRHRAPRARVCPTHVCLSPRRREVQWTELPTDEGSGAGWNWSPATFGPTGGR